MTKVKKSEEAGTDKDDGAKRVRVQVFFSAKGEITLSLPEALAEAVMSGEVTDMDEVVEASGSTWDDVLNMSEWEIRDAFEDSSKEQVPLEPGIDTSQE